MRQKIVFLEWIRGMAAVMVALAHLLAGLSAEFEYFTRNYLDLGRLGVVAFFLVSGYVISLSLRNDEVRSFLIKRMFRLYPIYIVAFTLFLALKFHDADWSHSGWLFEVIANYSMLQDLLGFAALLGPAWTLSIEWVFYGQQVVGKLARRLDQAWMLGYVWLFIYVAANVAERVLGRNFPVSLAMLLAVACLGQALYLAQSARISKRAFWTLAAAAAITIPVGSYIGLDKDGQWPPLVYSSSFLAGLAFFAAAFILRHRDGGRVLPWLGSISYSMYLLPPVVVTVVVSWTGGAFWPVLLLCAILIPLVGWLGYRYIERPSTLLGRSVAARYKARSAAPVV